MTTTNIFKDTEDLRKFARINAAVDQEVWAPGIPEAKQYIARYISAELLYKLETFAGNPTADKHLKKLLPLVQCVMAPVIMLNVSAELSLNISDRGHSVQKDDNSLPASDTKISRYEDALKKRAEEMLEVLLGFLNKNADHYPEYKKSNTYTRRLDCFFRSADDLHYTGLVNVQNRYIAYETLREGIIKAQERFVLPKTGQKLYAKLLSDSTDVEMKQLLKLASRFCANRAIALYLEATKKNAEHLLITPGDYSGDADFYFWEFEKYLIDHAEKLGITIFKSAEFNKAENKIFSSIL